jgi:hypothetical protein
VDLSSYSVTNGFGFKPAFLYGFEELFMKTMLYTFSALLLLSGCSQSKNRLADDNNVEYQKRNANKTKTTTPKATKIEILDLPPAPVDRGQSQELSQKPKTAELEASDGIPARNQSFEGASPTAPVVKNEKPKEAAAAATPAQTSVATAPAATAQSAAPAQAQSQTRHILSFEEYTMITNALKKNFASPEEINVILTDFFNVRLNPDIDTKKLSIKVKGTSDQLTAAIFYDREALTLVTDVAVASDGTLLQVDASNDYKFHAACAGDKCDILFIGFYKFTGDKVSINLFRFLKKVGEQYVISVHRPKAEYEEEAKKRANQASATAQN